MPVDGDVQTFFNPELLSLIRALVVGGDAHELELMLAEGVGLVKASDTWSGDQSRDRCQVKSRDKCHVTLLGSDDAHLALFAPFAVSRNSQELQLPTVALNIFCSRPDKGLEDEKKDPMNLVNSER